MSQFYTTPDPWSPLFGTDTEQYVCKDGEIVDIPVYVADWFRTIDEQRNTARLAFCTARGLNPDTFTGCHTCQGVGRDTAGRFCWCCDYGAELEQRDEERKEREWQAMIAAGKHLRIEQ